MTDSSGGMSISAGRATCRAGVNGRYSVAAAKSCSGSILTARVTGSKWFRTSGYSPERTGLAGPR